MCCLCQKTLTVHKEHVKYLIDSPNDSGCKKAIHEYMFNDPVAPQAPLGSVKFNNILELLKLHVDELPERGDRQHTKAELRSFYENLDKIWSARKGGTIAVMMPDGSYDAKVITESRNNKYKNK
jgi:hypothetical protein